jgi:hypothetical protein
MRVREITTRGRGGDESKVSQDIGGGRAELRSLQGTLEILLEAQPQTACQLDSVELRVDSSHGRRQLARPSHTHYTIKF